MLTYGIFTRKIAMMPLAKVTDMSFVRTIPGRVFGYGKFVLESAGQEQALHKVNWIPDAEPHVPRDLRGDLRGRRP